MVGYLENMNYNCYKILNGLEFYNKFTKNQRCN